MVGLHHCKCEPDINPGPSSSSLKLLQVDEILSCQLFSNIWKTIVWRWPATIFSFEPKKSKLRLKKATVTRRSAQNRSKNGPMLLFHFGLIYSPAVWPGHKSLLSRTWQTSANENGQGPIGALCTLIELNTQLIEAEARVCRRCWNHR